MKKVGNLTGVYVQDMKKVLKRTELSRCFDRKGYSMIILRALSPKTGYSPFGIYLNKKYIITVHKSKVFTIDDLFELLKGDQGKEFFSLGTSYLFCRIASYVTKRFHSEVDKLEDRVDKLEDDILDGRVKSPKKIFALKEILMNVRRALVSNGEVIDVVSDGTLKYLYTKNASWFSELKMEINQAISISEMSRERLTGTIDMYMSSVSNRLNDIMKSFTIIASLLLIPMLISGIWGMNFANIPFFENGFGFYVPLLIMVVCVIIMSLWFKRKKWM